jgi:hypothetical protein
MSELPPEPSIPAAKADPGRRKAAAYEARRAQTCAVTSAVGLGKINGTLAVTTIPVPCLHNLARWLMRRMRPNPRRGRRS